MRAIILAAGRGTQLGALTADRPKCLLPFGEETVLSRQIRLLGKVGIEKKSITIVAGYKAEQIPEDVYTIVVNQDYYKTDNSYSLYLGLENIREDVIILDGDLVFDEDVLAEFIAKQDGNYILCKEATSEFGGTGISIRGSSNTVSEIGKHIANSKYQYSGIVRIKKENIPALQRELSADPTAWYTIPLNNIVNTVPFYAAIATGKIVGINTLFDYNNAKSAFGIEKFKIMVTAASGFLGRKIYNILNRHYTVIGTKHHSESSDLEYLDLNNYTMVEAFLELIKPQVLINCAGIASPDVCDQNRDKAYQINVEAVKVLCEICHKHGCKVIHISTDYVFDGAENQEYSIETPANPVNYYGYTKAEAEKIVAAYKDNLIVRIPIIYGYNGSEDKETFPIRVLNALRDQETLYLDNKQIRYPVLIDEVAIMVSDALAERGIIHISSDEGVTKYTWAKVIAKVFGYDDALINEDTGSCLANRPPHVKLKLTQGKYLASNIEKGTQILKRQMKCAFKLIYSTYPTEYIYGESVGHYRYILGQQLGKHLPVNIINEIDCIVPIPNSGLYYAMGLSQSTKIPYVQGLFKADTRARSFQKANNLIREKLINTKIEPIRELIEGKTIALVDEAIFTGTTLKVICDICKACNAKKIYVCIPTPPCYNRCEQYMRPERELLSSYVRREELKDYFKVQDIFFQPYDVFIASLIKIEGICYECFEQTRRVSKA